MDEYRHWHRLFGLSLMDFFLNQPVTVEVEKDLSQKIQLLDVVIIRKEGRLDVQLPDGFEELAAHNLVSFKSYQEAMEGWTLLELLGHYVNYRKQVSPSMQRLLPESDFRLFAVSTRYPQGLASAVPLQRVTEGVYEVAHYTGQLRLVVINQLPRQQQNALLHLFSARTEAVAYGAEHYRLRSPETSTVLYQLFESYRVEGIPMPVTMEEFVRQTLAKVVEDLPAQERIEFLKKIPAEKRIELFNSLPAEKRIELLNHMPAEERVQGLSIEDRLAGLSPEEVLEALRRKAKQPPPADGQS